MELLKSLANSGFATSFTRFIITWIFSLLSRALSINSLNSFGIIEFTTSFDYSSFLPRFQMNDLGGMIYPDLLSAKYVSIGNLAFAKLIMSFTWNPFTSGTTLILTSLQWRTWIILWIKVLHSWSSNDIRNKVSPCTFYRRKIV